MCRFANGKIRQFSLDCSDFLGGIRDKNQLRLGAGRVSKILERDEMGEIVPLGRERMDILPTLPSLWLSNPCSCPSLAHNMTSE